MISYIISRLLQSIVTLLVIVTLLFFLLSILPGDAALLAGDPRMTQDPEVIANMRAKWGLDRPIHIRYLDYMYNLFKGNLGVSFLTNTSVNSLIANAFPHTFKLVLISFLISTTIGIFLGFVAAMKRGSFADLISMFLAIVGISAPRFWVGLMLMYFLSVSLNLLPSGGLGDGSLKFMILPAITLSIPLIALLARTTRSSVIEVTREDYVRTARAKGLLENAVRIKHILRNSLIPIITISGLQLGGLLANTVIVEKIFSLPGMGGLVVDSIHRRDLPAVQGCILIFSLGFILINLLIDLLYGYLDPRISYG